nr:hypothetical protein BgiMline_027610 [Biomphalaria glabrata]
MTGDEVTGDEVTGDEVTGDEVTGDEVTGDEVTGDEMTGDEMTRDEEAGDEMTGHMSIHRLSLSLLNPFETIQLSSEYTINSPKPVNYCPHESKVLQQWQAVNGRRLASGILWSLHDPLTYSRLPPFPVSCFLLSSLVFLFLLLE